MGYILLTRTENKFAQQRLVETASTKFRKEKYKSV
jgi:hypothetical protein